jgi:hypothetical protein
MNAITVYLVWFTKIIAEGEINFQTLSQADRIKERLDEIREDSNRAFPFDGIAELMLSNAYTEAKREGKTYLEPDRDDIASLLLHMPIDETNLQIYVRPEEGELECIGQCEFKVVQDNDEVKLGELDPEVFDHFVDSFVEAIRVYAN